MSSTLRIGFVGAGSIVRDRHAPGLRKCPGIEFRAVCNSTPESSTRAAEEFGILRAESSWQELARADDIDIVWVGTTPHLHAPVTIAALEAGKHVFCQARMAMNLSDARAMLAAAEKRPDRVTMLCPPPHGMKYGRYFRKLLEEGYIGKPLHFRLQALGAVWTDPGKNMHWRQDVALSGINMLSVGIYAEVIGKCLGYPRSIQAQLKVAQGMQAGCEVKIPDIVQVLGLWDGDLAGSLEWSGVARHAPGDRLEVYGSEGTLVYDFAKDVVSGAGSAGTALEVLNVPPDYVDGWTVEEDFVGAVRHGGSPEPSFNTGLRYMEFLEAVHLSHREKRAVELPLS